APSSVTQALARRSLPVMILARFAVDAEHQPTGLGQTLPTDALLSVIVVCRLHAQARCLRCMPARTVGWMVMAGSGLIDDAATRALNDQDATRCPTGQS